MVIQVVCQKNFLNYPTDASAAVSRTLVLPPSRSLCLRKAHLTIFSSKPLVWLILVINSVAAKRLPLLTRPLLKLLLQLLSGTMKNSPKGLVAICILMVLSVSLTLFSVEKQVIWMASFRNEFEALEKLHLYSPTSTCQSMLRFRSG